MNHCGPAGLRTYPIGALLRAPHMSVLPVVLNTNRSLSASRVIDARPGLGMSVSSPTSANVASVNSVAMRRGREGVVVCAVADQSERPDAFCAAIR